MVQEEEVSRLYAVVLIVGAICAFAFILRKIRKSEIKIADSTFWFLFAASLVLLAVFPQIANFFSNLLDIESPSNFVFLYVIAVLIIREFSMTVEVSKLRARISLLVQESALSSKREERED